MIVWQFIMLDNISIEYVSHNDKDSFALRKGKAQYRGGL